MVFKIGKEIGLGGRINTVLQSAFFALSNIIPADKANELMKAAAKATYGKKGDKIVQMNYDAIDAGAKNVVKDRSSGKHGKQLEKRALQVLRQQAHVRMQLIS